jgi:hypothetical protein
MAVARLAPRPTISADWGARASIHPEALRAARSGSIPRRALLSGRGRRRRLVGHPWQQHLFGRPLHLPGQERVACHRPGAARLRVRSGAALCDGGRRLWRSQSGRAGAHDRHRQHGLDGRRRRRVRVLARIGLPKSNTFTSISATLTAVWLAPTLCQPGLISRPTSWRRLKLQILRLLGRPRARRPGAVARSAPASGRRPRAVKARRRRAQGLLPALAAREPIRDPVRPL